MRATSTYMHVYTSTTLADVIMKLISRIIISCVHRSIVLRTLYNQVYLVIQTGLSLYYKALANLVGYMACWEKFQSM